MLKTSSGNLLPRCICSKAACSTRPGGCFLSGDRRVNQNIPIVAVYTLFVREHNRIAKKLGKINPQWSNENLFQVARKILIAVYQHIIYSEWVPTITPIKPYFGYDNSVNPQTSADFSTAAFRFAHSEIPNFISLLNANFDSIAQPITFQSSFFNNSIISKYGIESTIFGLIGNASSEVDSFFAESVFKKLLIPVGSSAFSNLAAINIQRGRDHGIPSYNEWRRWCGSVQASDSFDEFRKEITSVHDRKVLKKLYGSVRNHIDLFVAGMLEKKISGLQVGPTFKCLIKKHFEDGRDGDRFFYQRAGVFTKRQLKEIRKVTISSLLCNNLKGIVSVQRNAFHIFRQGLDKRIICSSVPQMNLMEWKVRTKT